MRRLRLGEWLAGASGLGMLIVLALPWYGDASGFESLSVIDILLVLVALLALSLPVLQATQRSPALPVAAAVLCVAFGFIAVLLVLFRLIDEPRDGYEVAFGAWLGLVAALGITAGGWLSLANEHVPGGPPGPEPELRPAPLGS